MNNVYLIAHQLCHSIIRLPQDEFELHGCQLKRDAVWHLLSSYSACLAEIDSWLEDE